jgi:hypothetical protein
MSLGPFSHSCKINASSGYITDVMTGFALTLRGFPTWLMIKVVCLFEILMTVYQTTWYQVPECREIKTEIHKYCMRLFSFRVLALPVLVPKSESSARSAGLWIRYKIKFDVSKHGLIHTAHNWPAWHAGSFSTWDMTLSLWPSFQFTVVCWIDYATWCTVVKALVDWCT